MESTNTLNIALSLEQYQKDNRSNFQKVSDWNKTFGVKTLDFPNLNIFKNDPKFVEYRMNLIREEVSELEDAVKKGDMVETIDALSDILVVIYGMGASLGINLDETMHLVNDSNMSKSCASEEEAIETVEWYKKNEPRYDTPTYKKSNTGNYWIVYNRSSGKILKSIRWKIVDFEDYMKRQK
jgi:predicted HAD superfamily Cof-like phosphohydrolase